MRDIRTFANKSTQQNATTITEGTIIGELATDMPSKQETLPIDNSKVPTNLTVNDDETTSKLIEDSEGKYDEDDVNSRMELFYNFVKEKGITDDIIRDIQKNILQGERVIFKVTILKKLNLELTTRPAWVNELIIEELNKYSNVSYQMYIDIVSKVNLAASLVSFDGHVFKPLTAENYKERVEELRKLPSFIYDKMVNELVIFDRLIAVATSDKYLETFI